MDDLAPKARYDALALLFRLDEAAISGVRSSVGLLLPEVSELVRMFDETMRSRAAATVLGPAAPEQRETLQSVLASFIMRTIGCNFDEDYCNYAHEISRGELVPRRLFSVGLGTVGEFVAQTLPGKVDEPERLAGMLAAWNRLLCVLRELTRD